MQVTALPPVISERALTLSLRLRIAELDDQQHAAIGSSAIPDRLEVPPDTSAAWIYGAYAVVLSRAPDDEGLATFRRGLESSMQPDDLLHELRNSAEGRDKRARLPADPLHAFVTGCYLLTLGRSASDTELLEAQAALEHGRKHGHGLGDYLATLIGTDEARQALRFPPAPPDRDAALTVAIQQVAGHAEDAATTARLHARLVAGESVTNLLKGEMHLRRRNLLARIRVRLTQHSLAAQVESIAASLLAQRESALTRELIWRIQLDQWKSAPRRDEPALSQRQPQWYQ